MIKLSDYKCDSCGEIAEDLVVEEDDKTYKCHCGGIVKRIYGTNKRMQMLPHWNEHLGHEPVYIEDREHFDKELKKRGLGAISLKKSKERKYFF